MPMVSVYTSTEDFARTNCVLILVPSSLALSFACADMRTALRRDKKKESVVPLKDPITPAQLEW
jgi:hypothetical protein